MIQIKHSISTTRCVKQQGIKYLLIPLSPRLSHKQPYSRQRQDQQHNQHKRC